MGISEFIARGRRRDCLSGDNHRLCLLDAPLDPSNANRYAYAGDDPTNSSDPTGRLNTATKANLAETGVGALEAAAIVGIFFIPGLPVFAGIALGVTYGAAFGAIGGGINAQIRGEGPEATQQRAIDGAITVGASGFIPGVR